MKNIKNRVTDIRLAYSEAIEKIMDGNREFQKAMDEQVLFNSDQLKEIQVLQEEINHYLCEASVIHSKAGMVELRGFVNDKISVEELNKPVA